MISEEQEERLILFAVLQDIANELRKIKCERQEAQKAESQEQFQNNVGIFAYIAKED
jgi:hypothetical protein